jgi:hypothetical protein
LCKHFYEVLGEDIANELVEWFNSVDATYRSDLRELNEVNFARFDAKLEQRIGEIRAEMREGFSQVNAKLEQRVTKSELDLRHEIATLRGEMRAANQELKADLLKWGFGGWATLLGALIALTKIH